MSGQRSSGGRHSPSNVGARAIRMLLAVLCLVLLVGLGSMGTGAAQGNPQPQVTAGVDYGDPGDAHTQLDVYAPGDGKTGRAAVVVVHGGGWTGGSRAEMAPDAMALAQHGFVAFSIDYHVDSSPRWPNELDDVQRAVRWVQDNAGTYGVDPARIGLFGSSAGGNLAMLVGTLGTGDGHPPVRAVASWSGPTDLTTIAVTNIDGAILAAPSTVPIPGAETPPGCVGNAACIGLVGPNYLQAFMDCTLPECPEQYRDASPVFQVSESSAPMFLAAAEIDLVPVEQNFEMDNALRAAGVRSELFVVQGAQHAESFRAAVMQPTIDFLTKQLVEGRDPHVPKGSPPVTAAGSAAIPATTADARLPVPAIPAAAAPRTGAFGYLARHRAAATVVGIVVVLVLVVVLLSLAGTRRRRAAATA